MPLQLSLRSIKSAAEKVDVLVVGVYSFAASKKKTLDLPELLERLDQELGGALRKRVEKEEFRAKKDQTLSLSTLGRLSGERLVLFGLGERESLAAPDVRTFAAKAARIAGGDKARSLEIVLPEGAERFLRAAAEGLELGSYRFAKYLTGDRAPKVSLERVSIVNSGKAPREPQRQLEIGQKIGAAVNVSRDLGNEPGNTMTPVALAQAAAAVSKQNRLHIEVFDFKEIMRRGMKLIQAVGQGSVIEPRFVHMTYMPGKKAKKRFVFVGKGITFDTGGICIKPAAGMGEMKTDMCGAANMVGLMAAVAAVQPNVEVHAIMACAENMPDGKAYRPGDIWGSLDGKFVEITNTDAEGRLVLADALAYARELKPDLLVDNATLTGACLVALGTSCSGYYASTDDANNRFSAAIKAAGETMWRMPLLDDLKDQLKTDVADLKNAGDRYGGSITAALFLREFIGDVKNWVHVDIAGPSNADRVAGWNPKGATGHAILTFLALIEAAS